MAYGIWSLFDNKAGILCKVDVYKGKSKEPENMAEPLRERIILKLSLKGHVIYSDNFFSSRVLFQKQITRGIGAYGTVRANKNICLQT
jgi:hypothetical protein